MSRALTPDGKRVTVCAKLSEPDAGALDAARGDLTRSAWLQSAIGAALAGGPAWHDGGQDEARRLRDRIADLEAELEQARESPASDRCRSCGTDLACPSCYRGDDYA